MFRVSERGYYDRLDRGPSMRWSQNEIITATIRDILKDSFGSYGAPRIKAELLKKGISCFQTKSGQDNEGQ